MRIICTAPAFAEGVFKVTFLFLADYFSFFPLLMFFIRVLNFSSGDLLFVSFPVRDK